MRNIWTVYRREVGTYFDSPIAYIFIVLFVLIQAFLFFVVNDFFGMPYPDVRGYYGFLPWVFAVFIPAVTMRLWSEEKRAGTIELLMTSPFKSWELVVAKFLAAYTVIVVSLFLTILVPISVDFVMDFDWNIVFATYVGALLMASVYIALGAWISTLTQNQIVALLVSVTCCFLIAFLGSPRVIDFLNGVGEGIGWKLGTFVGWFGTYGHFQEFTRGLINPVDLIYALSLTAFFLTLNNVFVEGRKY
ncbi:MAG TPA: ABC transporter permease subunit [Planctomycetota bacterium]|nr:ABC transporter permease subunit [Planctomycetota bacterium]